MSTKPGSEDLSFFKDKLKEDEPVPEKPAAEPEAQAAEAKAKTQHAEISLNDLIIVVDDSPTILTVITGILKKIGFGSLAFRDGEAAISHIRGMTPEELVNIKAIFSDIDMPKMNGLDLLREIRGDERFVKMPFVLITSIAERDKIQKAKALKVNGYLLKPVTSESLTQTASNLFPGRVAFQPDTKVRAK